MKKVLLVFPGKIGLSKKVNMPLHLLSLAGALKRHNYNISIFDGRMDSISEIDINNIICVGITTMTGKQILDGLKIAKYIRKKNKKIPIIWGGVHPTIMPESTIKNPFVDVVVRWEGEDTFLELVQAFDKKKEKEIDNIKGITYIKNSKIINNPDRELTNLNELDTPPYELLKLDNYYTDQISINTSRGCPHRCTFCVQNREWHKMSSKNLIKEIKIAIKKFNPKEIGFADANFFCDKKNVEEFCKLKIKEKIKILWGSACRLDYFARYDDSFISLLKKSGLKVLFFGGESGSQRVLDEILQKDIKVEDIIESVRKCKKYKIIPVISFMMGNLGETKKEIKTTLKLIDKLIKINPDTEVNGIFIYSPWPGTPLFEKAVKAGLKVPRTLEGWGTFDMGSINNNKYLSSRYKKYLKTIQSVSRFPFTKQINPFVKKHQKFSFFKELGYQFYCWSARTRWKYKFFYLGFEWRIMEHYLKRFGRI